MSKNSNKDTIEIVDGPVDSKKEAAILSELFSQDETDFSFLNDDENDENSLVGSTAKINKKMGRPTLAEEKKLISKTAWIHPDEFKLIKDYIPGKGLGKKISFLLKHFLSSQKRDKTILKNLHRSLMKFEKARGEGNQLVMEEAINEVDQIRKLTGLDDDDFLAPRLSRRAYGIYAGIRNYLDFGLVEKEALDLEWKRGIEKNE